MLCRYTTIQQILLKVHTEKTQHLLTDHLLIADDHEFHVCLSDGWFNPTGVVEVVSETPVQSLDDVRQYCQVHHIDYVFEHQTPGGLLVGVAKDCLIHEDLSAAWITED